jgi:hypothetical protein
VVLIAEVTEATLDSGDGGVSTGFLPASAAPVVNSTGLGAVDGAAGNPARRVPINGMVSEAVAAWH